MTPIKTRHGALRRATCTALRPATVTALAVLACVLGLAGPAQATLVVVDPDSAANLADISTAYAAGPFGVTLSASGSSTSDGKVYSLDPTNGGASCCNPPTGSQAFALNRGALAPALTEFWSRDALVASLGFLAATVAIDYQTDGVFELRAYDAANALLGSIDSNADSDGTLNLGFASAQIARVDIRQTDAGTGDAAMLDHLVFNTDAGTVPEPGTWGLVALASGLLALQRRRQGQTRPRG